MNNQYQPLTHKEKVTPLSRQEQKLALMSLAEYLAYIDRTSNNCFIPDPRQYAKFCESQRNSQYFHSQTHSKLKARFKYQQAVGRNTSASKSSYRVAVVAGSRKVGDFMEGKEITGFGKAWAHKETGVMFCYAYLR